MIKAPLHLSPASPDDCWSFRRLLGLGITRAALFSLLGAITATNVFADPSDDSVAGSAGDELRSIDARLAELPSPDTHADTPRGFHSGFHSRPVGPASVFVDMRRAYPIDRLVLVPTSLTTNQRRYIGYGFPPRYEVLGSLDGTAWTPLVVVDTPASRTSALPAVHNISPLECRYLQIRPIELYERSAGLWLFALAEFMAFEGPINRAEGATVDAITSVDESGQWSPERLVDGLSDLNLPVERLDAPGANGFHSGFASAANESRWVQIDLEQETRISRVRLVPAAPPERSVSDYGFPPALVVELSNDPTFAAESILNETRSISVTRPGANRVSIRVDGGTAADSDAVSARYVRVRATELTEDSSRTPAGYFFALAELEVIGADSKGTNLALGKKVTASHSLRDRSPNSNQPGSAGSEPNRSDQWSLAALTDGLTPEGRLIPMRDWIDRYEERRTLEAARTRLVDQVSSRDQSVRSTSTWGTLGLVAAIAVAAAAMLWRQRRLSLERIRKLRRQIARDLHDEIGSSLASIRLTSALGADSPDNPDTAIRDFREIGDAAAAANDAIRDIVWLIDVEQASSRQLIVHLRGLARQILGPVDVVIHDEQNWSTPTISMERRRNIVLAFKETLTNIRRHAETTKVEIDFTVRFKEFSFRVTDNGIGLTPEAVQFVESLQDSSIGFDGLIAREPLMAGEPASGGANDPSTSSEWTEEPTVVRHGMRNMISRAEELGGDCQIAPIQDGTGVVVFWRIGL